MGVLNSRLILSVILALLIALTVVYLIRNHTNYGAALPPGLPADIPIVEGEVISGRRTLFEDGRGYVVDIRYTWEDGGKRIPSPS